MADIRTPSLGFELGQPSSFIDMSSRSPTSKRQKLGAFARAFGRSLVPTSLLPTNRVQSSSDVADEARVPKKRVAWTGLESALQGLRLSSGSFPALQSAVDTLRTCLEVFEQPHREEYEKLAVELEAVAKFLSQHLGDPKSPRIMSTIVSISRAIEKEVKLITEIKDGSSARRILRTSNDEEALVRVYRRVTELFLRLQVEIGMDAWSIANEHLANTRLESLNPVKQARYDSTLGADFGRRPCAKGTRESTLGELYQWSDDPQTERVYLLNGMAGTGKTTIAYTLAKILEDDGRLGASFFCTRASEPCRDANRILSTVAYQLARYSTAFQSALCLALDADPDLGSRSPNTQFERLLREPLLQVKDKIPKHVVVVIDALDECSNPKAARLVFDLLTRFADEIPIKFFVTGRPDSRVLMKALSSNDVVHVLHLHEIEHALVQSDIELYLWEELACIEPSRPQIAQLAKLAGSLFIFAATAVRYIRPDEVMIHSTERLLTILNNEFKPHSKGLADIDSLYSTVLASALENDRLETEEIERIKVILQAAASIQEPVSMQTLAILAGLGDSNHVLTALEPLRSVLHVSERTGLVYMLHASFSDFLHHRERSGRFFCDKAEQNRTLVRRCFEVMGRQLRFNICDLHSSYIFDQSVPDLEARIESNISAPLVYACQHWANHLCLAPVSLELCSILYAFLCDKLLFWMEVLNLEQRQVDALHALPNAQNWITGSDAFYDLRILIHHTIGFVTRFFTTPASLSTPHIYVSALPVSTGRVREIYLKRSTGMVEYWDLRPVPSIDLALDAGEGSALTCFALSPDGTSVAAGSNHGAIRLWDIGTRRLLASSFVGSAESILAIRFSPDGRYIASGARDGSIWVSSYANGKLINICGPFEGHRENAWSVDFSPDGKRIASGSGDYNVRVWDVAEDQLIAEPYRGHSGAVHSIRFSPDGTKVASGSSDCSICIWDTANGRLSVGPLEGHTGIIWSVDFSPDGKLLASGSNDGNLCVWDIASGRLIGSPIESKMDKSGILSVKFSSDGGRIYCGSRDNILHVWDVVKKELFSLPPGTRADEACSIATSPDGMHILSNQYGQVVRFNDHFLTEEDEEEGFDMSGSTSPIRFNPKAARVGFSSEGNKIISASKSGRMTCMWGSASGKPITGPLKGRFDTAWSVVYPGGDTRISTRSNSRAVHIWDRESGTIIAGPFQEEASHVFRLRALPDGQRTISTNSTTLTLFTPHATKLGSEPEGMHGTSNAHNRKGNSSSATSTGPGSTRTTLQTPREAAWTDATSEYPESDTTTQSSRPTRNSRTTNSSPLGRASSRGVSELKRWGPEAHSLSLWSVALSPDGTRVALTGLSTYEHDIEIWDAALDHSIVGPFRGHGGSVRSVGFSPDGARMISGSDDRNIQIWDAAQGIALGNALEGHTDSVLSAVFSPDGKYIASGSGDRTVRIWDTINQTSMTFRKHADRVWVVDFSPNGSRVISSSLDQTIIVWDVTNGTVIAGPFVDEVARIATIPIMNRLQGRLRYSHGRPVPSSASWLLRADGWWTNGKGELLFWVHPEQRRYFQESYDEQTRFEDKINLGEKWYKCYPNFNPARRQESVSTTTDDSWEALPFF